MIDRDAEKLGVGYDAALMLELRQRTREAVNHIASLVSPGMLEEDAVAAAKNYLTEQGLLRGWHGVFVRFGTNTVKFYGAESERCIRLASNDIFIVDIGPVFGKLEGDGGDTFVVGDDPEMHRAATDVHVIFNEVHSKWRGHGMTGRELYDFAAQRAQSRGWQLNLELAGHRIGNFPHAAVFNGTLADIDFYPSSQLWVLEMHIRHPTRRFGAFFEDMLV